MRPTASDVSICHYRLSRVEYDRAVEAGAFEPDAKLELIDGDLSAMTPEGVGHTTGMDLVADRLQRVFGSRSPRLAWTWPAARGRPRAPWRPTFTARRPATRCTCSRSRRGMGQHSRPAGRSPASGIEYADTPPTW